MLADTIPTDRANLAEIINAIANAVSAKLDKPPQQLLDQPTAMCYVGLKRSGWFRAKSADLLPRPVFIEGSGERWRRKDLDGWVERLKPRRK